jgi:hypothetical protein
MCAGFFGRCSATANWVGASDWIEFRSNTSACSFSGYRIGNDFSCSITITDGSYRDEFLRTTKQRPEVEACVVCATKNGDEAHRKEGFTTASQSGEVDKQESQAAASDRLQAP